MKLSTVDTVEDKEAIFHPLMIFKGPFRSDEEYPRGLIGPFDWGDQQITCEGTCH